MRATMRLLASVQRSSQFLEPGAPTGLTGLLTHSSPRSTLLYLYSSTLEKLKTFPESSVYRQSTENVTRHRMQILESIKPTGLNEWHQRIETVTVQFPDAFRKIPVTSKSGENEFNIVWKDHTAIGAEAEEWDGEIVGAPQLVGIRTEREGADQGRELARNLMAERAAIPRIEPEPPLTVDQINEIEQKIASGLIEEVVEVAEGEKLLVDVMAENKVWEGLEEKPGEGQWTYYARDRHTPQTQAR